MGKHEQITVSDKPPVPSAPAVVIHRKQLEANLDRLKAGVAELALASVMGDVAARAALAAIPGKVAALQFEIDQNHAAHALAVKNDHAAEAGWRQSLQAMQPEQL